MDRHNRIRRHHCTDAEYYTGRRTLFREFAPADRTGLLSTPDIFVTDDLRSYAYTAYYQVSSLFVSEGKQ
jgi:hypothetical protein